MQVNAKKLKISYNAVYCSLHRLVQNGSNQNRKRSGRPRCTTEQEDKYIRVFSLRNRRLISPQLAASLNIIHKTPVSMSTVKRRLGMLDFQAEMQKGRSSDWPIKNKRLKEHRHWKVSIEGV